jgi:hypothetical protein
MTGSIISSKNDPRFLRHIGRARKSWGKGRGVRIEDIE